MSEEVVNNVQEINEEVSTSDADASKANLMSFDDLDNLTDDRSDKDLLDEAKKLSEEKGEEDKPQNEVKSEGKAEEANASKEAEEAEVEEIKKLLGKYGDDEMEIASETLFKHKVDGEDVDVSLQELLNNYSGKISYDKKFQEFSENKKDFDEYKADYDQDINLINGYINDFASKLKSNDALGALSYFAEFSGMEPHDFKRQLLDQLTPEIERRTLLTPEQHENERLAEQNEYLSRQQESEVIKRQEEQANDALWSEIRNLQEAHSISDENFEAAYQELADSDFDGQINPEAVAEYYVHSTAFVKSEEVLSEVNPDLVNDDNIVESLQKVIVENPSFDNNDLIDIVQEVYGNAKKEASKTVSKKVAQSEKKQELEVSKEKQSFASFDDL